MPRDEDTPDTVTIGRAVWAESQKRNRNWSVDELLLHPTTASEVCKAVRASLCKKLRDDQILRALLNTRKRPML